MKYSGARRGPRKPASLDREYVSRQTMRSTRTTHNEMGSRIVKMNLRIGGNSDAMLCSEQTDQTF